MSDTDQTTFLCSALHQIPSMYFLEQVRLRNNRTYGHDSLYHTRGRKRGVRRSQDDIIYQGLSEYVINWIDTGKAAKRNRTLKADETCLVRVVDNKLEFLAIPALDKSDAPYMVCYNVYLSRPEAKINNECLQVVSQYGGFSICTLASHDWSRAQRLASNNKMPEIALMYADRAIMALADQLPGISAEQEKLYATFAKLRDLFVSAHGTPEGNLAYRRATEFVSRLYDSLYSSL